jgi:predicted RNA binding protein YcfA (HicA-like mRNA interferase family)
VSKKRRRLPSLKAAEVIRVLERNGFHRITKRKKHRIYTDGTHIVPVPFHTRDLKPGTLRSIISQAGWTVEEFLQKL